MRPSTSATTTSPGPRSPGRLQSISRMDGVPEANRRRNLWGKRSRPSLQACLKVVDFNLVFSEVHISDVFHSVVFFKSRQRLFHRRRNILFSPRPFRLDVVQLCLLFYLFLINFRILESALKLEYSYGSKSTDLFP